MRSVNVPSSSEVFVVRLAPGAALELERCARAARAQAIGDLVAGAILWIARLPRRIVGRAQAGAVRQRV